MATTTIQEAPDVCTNRSVTLSVLNCSVDNVHAQQSAQNENCSTN